MFVTKTLKLSKLIKCVQYMFECQEKYRQCTPCTISK